LEGWALKIETFLGCEMAMSKTQVHTITNVPFYMAVGPNDFDASKSITQAIGRGGPLKLKLFWDQMALTLLFAINSLDTPFNGHCNGLACIKIIP
jgi:hypothetical protein